MIVDTSFLVHLFRGEVAAFDKGVELSEAGVVQRVPTPVLVELSYGVVRFGNGDERRKFKNAVRTYPLVELTRELSNRAGVLLAEADENAGGDSGIDKIDATVAAVAEHYDEPVLTENVDDFDQLGVAVETY